MNRRIIVTTTLIALLGLAACQSEGNSNKSGMVGVTIPERATVSIPKLTPTDAPTPELTVTNTPVPTATSTPTPVPTLTSTPVPTATPTPEPTPTPAPISKYTFKDIEEVRYVKKNVNFRDLPSTDGEKLGELKKGAEIIVTGKCNENSWYRFIYGTTVAYVSGNYLSTKPVVTPTPTPSPKPTQRPDPATGEVPKLVMLPLGEETSSVIADVSYSVDADGNQYGIIEYADGTTELHTLYWEETINGYMIAGVVFYPDGHDFSMDYCLEDMPAEHPKKGTAPFRN